MTVEQGKHTGNPVREAVLKMLKIQHNNNVEPRHALSRPEVVSLVCFKRVAQKAGFGGPDDGGAAYQYPTGEVFTGNEEAGKESETVYHSNGIRIVNRDSQEKITFAPHLHEDRETQLKRFFADLITIRKKLHPKKEGDKRDQNA